MGSGCNRFLAQTKSGFSNILAPVNPDAGPVRPIQVQAGNPATRVAIVDVDGLILDTPFVGPMSVGENPVALFREKLKAIECDPCVKGVVLRLNSPGGGVAACLMMRRDLLRFKAHTNLPVVACMMDECTGGAYALASAADNVIAGPATVTGAVGVILNLFNLRDLMAQFNIIPQIVKSGEYVDIGTSARALDPAERQLLQTMADDFHKQLEADILQSRPSINLAGGKTFDGRIFTGPQAMALGLVDRIGDLDDAIEMTAQLSCPAPGRLKRGGGPPQVVMYRRTNDPATSIYAITANIPLQGAGLLPNLPGLDRSKLPTFLSLWEPELTTEKLGGK
jgi:protease-4